VAGLPFLVEHPEDASPSWNAKGLVASDKSMARSSICWTSDPASRDGLVAIASTGMDLEDLFREDIRTAVAFG
jgi:hypothetical protein